MFKSGSCPWFAIALAFSISVSLSSAQDISSLIGEPAHARVLSVRFGQANLDTGDLHLEIPLYSVPERGMAPNTITLVYDSFFWHPISDFGNPMIGTNVYPTGTGWYIRSGDDNGGMGAQSVPNSVVACSTQRAGDLGTITQSNNWIATDAHGTRHDFFLHTVVNTCTYANTNTPDTTTSPQSSGGTAYALDGTGYRLTVAGDGMTSTVIAPDGTAGFTTAPGAVLFGSETPNGNVYGSWAAPAGGDELGGPLGIVWNSPQHNCVAPDGSSLDIRQVSQVVSNQPYSARSPVTCTASIPAWDGGATTAQYSFTYEYVPVCSNLYPGSPGSDYCGGMWVLKSVNVPGGLGSYVFEYDTGTSGAHQGLLTSITLPTGGTVTYGYGTATTTTLAPFVTSISDLGGTTQISYTRPSGNPYPETITFPPHPSMPGGTTMVQDQRVISAGSSSTTVTAAPPYTIQDFSGSVPIQTTTENRDGSNRITSVSSTWTATGENHTVQYKYADDPSVSGYQSYGGVAINLIAQASEYDSGTLVRTLTTQYMRDTATIPYVSQYNMINYPVSKTLQDGAGHTAAQTLYTYDEYSASYCQTSAPAGLPGIPMLTSIIGASGHDDSRGTSYFARGNVTTMQQLVSAGVYVTSHNCYDTLGNVLQTVDGNNHSTRFSYLDSYLENACIPASSSTYAFPTVATDALGHQTKTAYYTCNRAAGRVQNPNDLANSRNGTTTNYDIAGRPLCVSTPDGGSTCISYPSSNEVDTTTSINAQNSQTTRALLDDFGRTTSKIDNSSGIRVDTSYDELGRTNCVSNPYTSGTSGATCYAYDVLSRITGVSYPDGSTESRQYSGNTVTTTDVLGNQTKKKTDSLGRLKFVWEPNGVGQTPTMETDYSYDALNNLTSVTQWGGSSGSSGARTRSFAYDGLSRLLQAYNPESGWTCYGTTGGAAPTGSNCTAGYDGNSNLLAKTDARGITITYSFDALNRLTWKHYSDGETPIGFGYDGKDENGNPLSGLSNPILTLSHVSNEVNAASTFSYDPMGRVLNKSSCIPGDCSYDINAQATYDLMGNMSSLTNGIGNSAITLNYSYDGSNRLNSITSSWNDATHPPTLFSTPVYGPMGLLSANVGADSSNNPTITLSRAYDNRGRLTSEGDASAKVPTGSATGSSGSITVSGSEQSSTRASGTATATLNVTGTEQTYSFNPCVPHGSCPQTIYDSGGDTVYVNGVSAGGLSWGQGATTSALAASLASSINANGNSPVTAAASGSSVVLTSKIAGPSGNYSISVTRSWNTTYFSSPSFSLSAPSAMSGGTNTTVYDHGTVSVTINNTNASATWSSGTNAGSLTAALASALATADVSFLTVSSSGNTISLNSTGTGVATNWPIQFSVTYDSADFGSASFSLSVNGMSGGQGATYQNQSLYTFSVPAGGFDAAGNLKTVTDSVTGSWSYSYDTLNRLLTATPTSGPYAGQHGCWAYDAFGNRTAESWQSAACATPETNVPATASYNTSNLVTWTSVNAAVAGFQYDATGNVTNDNSNAYLYDAEGRLCAVKNLTVGSMTGYVYDGLGNRVAKGSLSNWACNFGSLTVTSRYVVGITGEQLSEVSGAGAWVKTNVFGAGKLLATYHDTDTYFALTDWLGTKRGEVTPDGLFSTYFSLPFGNGPISSGNATDATTHHFTGKEHDSESGNDYFGARYYQSTVGRFVSPDPSGIAFANPLNPQSLNLYSYALNSPLKFIDPNGLYCAWEDGTSDDDPSDGGANYTDCKAQGGHWTDESNPCQGADNCVATFNWNQPPQTQFVAFPGLITGGVQASQMDPRQLMLRYLRSCEGHAPGGGYGAYNDSKGFCTTGYGQLLHQSPCTAQDYAAYQGETEAQAEAQLERDYDQANRFIQNNAPDSTQGQRDAFVDQAFNMGIGTAGKPHGMVNHDAWKDFKMGNNAAVPGDIMTLTAGGPGIRTRRTNEVNMFLYGIYPANCY